MSDESQRKNRSAVAIHKRNVREGLEPRREPYWGARLAEGRYIGFRKIDVHHGSWIARARLDDELRERLKLTGQQTYRNLGPVDKLDYDAACAAARAWFGELTEGVVTDKPFTVADACTEYVDELRREKGDGAADDAKWRFERSGIYEGAIGRTEVAKLRTPALKKWRTDLLTEDDEDRQMTKAGANRMMTSLRAALNLAVKNKRVSASAAPTWGDVEQYKNADGRRGDEHFLSIEQRRALLEAASGNVRSLIEAALLIGARPGELVKATRSQFDARTKTLKLSHRKGDGTVRERDVPLIGPALTLFERLAKSKLPSALLLTRDDGQPWTRIEWSRQIRAAAEAAVVKDAKGNILKDDKGHAVKLPAGVCLYSCRHTYISQAIMDGLTTLDVAKLTGTSLAMIDKHYGKYVKDAVRERLAKVQML